MKGFVSNYVDCVSFQDLSSALIDKQMSKMRKNGTLSSCNFPFLHIPPQYNSKYIDDEICTSKRPIIKLNLGYESQSKQGISEAYREIFEGLLTPGVRNSGQVSSVSLRSARKLAPGPKVSILKIKQTDKRIDDFGIYGVDEKFNEEIVRITQQNTECNSGSYKGYTTSGFNNLHEPEDDLLKKSKKNALSMVDSKLPNRSRRSYANMTDEEVAELEKNLGPRTLNYDLSMFDFSKQNTFYGSSDFKRHEPLSFSFIASNLVHFAHSCVLYRAMSCSKAHSDYGSYIADHADQFSCNVMRTVVCHISGRRHTWSAVDWYICNLARDGDHLVILTCLPQYDKLVNRNSEPVTKKHAKQASLDEYDVENFGKHSFSNFSLRSENIDVYELSELMTILDLDELVKERCRAIVDYYSFKCKDKVLKVTVEAIKDDSRTKSLAQATTMYKPELQLVSTVSMGFDMQLRNGHLKLPNYIVKHIPIPVMVVPNETLRPWHIDSSKKKEAPLPKDVQLNMIDDIIKATLKNLFESNSKPGSISILSNSDSVADYCLSDDGIKKKREQFRLLGYIPCTSIRFINSPTRSQGLFLGSRRSQIYKVKSLIDNTQIDSKPVQSSILMADSTKTKLCVMKSIPVLPSIDASSANKDKDKRSYKDKKNKKNKKNGNFGGLLKKIGLKFKRIGISDSTNCST